jgi:hypothetical protein
MAFGSLLQFLQDVVQFGRNNETEAQFGLGLKRRAYSNVTSAWYVAIYWKKCTSLPGFGKRPMRALVAGLRTRLTAAFFRRDLYRNARRIFCLRCPV